MARNRGRAFRLRARVCEGPLHQRVRLTRHWPAYYTSSAAVTHAICLRVTCHLPACHTSSVCTSHVIPLHVKCHLLARHTLSLCASHAMLPLHHMLFACASRIMRRCAKPHPPVYHLLSHVIRVRRPRVTSGFLRRKYDWH